MSHREPDAYNCEKHPHATCRICKQQVPCDAALLRLVGDERQKVPAMSAAAAANHMYGTLTVLLQALVGRMLGTCHECSREAGAEVMHDASARAAVAELLKMGGAK